MGMSIITLTLTYFLEVYNALHRRNTFCLKIHLATAETGDAAELVAGIGPEGEFTAGYAHLAEMSAEMIELKESHHFYPVLFYFRFRDPHYAVARQALVTLDAVTLIKSALEDERYAWSKESAAVAQLWRASMHLLTVLAVGFLPGGLPQVPGPPNGPTLDRWRRRYFAGVRRLRQAGIKSFADEQLGAEVYVSLRASWDRYIKAFADFMAEDLDIIDPAGATPKTPTTARNSASAFAPQGERPAAAVSLIGSCRSEPQFKPRPHIRRIGKAQHAVRVEKIEAGAEPAGERVAAGHAQRRVLARVPVQAHLGTALLEQKPPVMRQAVGMKGLAADLVRPVHRQALHHLIADIGAEIGEHRVVPVDLQVFDRLPLDRAERQADDEQEVRVKAMAVFDAGERKVGGKGAVAVIVDDEAEDVAVLKLPAAREGGFAVPARPPREGAVAGIPDAQRQPGNPVSPLPDRCADPDRLVRQLVRDQRGLRVRVEKAEVIPDPRAGDLAGKQPKAAKRLIFRKLERAAGIGLGVVDEVPVGLGLHSLIRRPGLHQQRRSRLGRATDGRVNAAMKTPAARITGKRVCTMTELIGESISKRGIRHRKGGRRGPKSASYLTLACPLLGGRQGASICGSKLALHRAPVEAEPCAVSSRFWVRE